MPVKRVRKNIVKLFTLLAVLSAVICVLLFWRVECLTAEYGDKLFFAWHIREGESFEVTFTHSLNLSPITDVIEWTGEEMTVRKSVFKAFGAGVPIPADGIGTELIHKDDGYYELVGIDKPMQSFTIMTQEVPNHKITLNGYEAFLLELAGSGKPVEIAVKKIPLICLLVQFAK